MKTLKIKSQAWGNFTAEVDGQEVEQDGIFTDLDDLLLHVLAMQGVEMQYENRDGWKFEYNTNQGGFVLKEK